VAAQQAALADIIATRQLQQATIAGSAASLQAAAAAAEKLANDNRRYNALAASSAISAQIRDNASADYRRARAEQDKAKRIKPPPNASWRCWMPASNKPWPPWPGPG
jgi:membrane fusion protein (multidrug efflux system)